MRDQRNGIKRHVREEERRSRRERRAARKSGNRLSSKTREIRASMEGAA